VSSEELQVTELLKFFVLVSSKFPVATNFAVPPDVRFGALGLPVLPAQPGQVTVIPVSVGLTKKPLQLIALASKKRAANDAITRNFDWEFDISTDHPIPSTRRLTKL